MARLPVVAGDTGAWGTLLNAFLTVAHAADGTIASLQRLADGKVLINSAAGNSAGVVLQDRVNSFVEIRPRSTASAGAVLVNSNPLNLIGTYWDVGNGRETQVELNLQVLPTSGPSKTATVELARVKLVDTDAGQTVLLNQLPIQIQIDGVAGTARIVLTGTLGQLLTLFSTKDLVNFNTAAGTEKLELVNGTVLRQYTDNYSTVTTTLTGTGALTLQAQNTGSTLFSGSGVPSNGLGANGDFFFRSDGTVAGHTVLYHKESGAWVASGA